MENFVLIFSVCVVGVFLNLRNVSGSGYIGVNSDMSWSDANAYCESTYGTTLAKITSDEENTLVREAATAAGISSRVWIGASDDTTEDTFLWVDGSSVDYSNWASGEPNDYGSGEDCAEQYSGGTWNDRSCTSTQAFVCNDVTG